MIAPIRVLAPNPGPFTLEGTNTWIVGTGRCVVIDPGPEDRGHVEEILRRAGRIDAILLTHRHPDHAPAARRLSRRSGAAVFAFRPSREEERLHDGQEVVADGVRLRTVHTPGHTRDHVVFHDAERDALFTGDAVLGRGTSVIDPPDGEMADYIRSLRTMRALGPRILYPGHGPVVWDAPSKLEEYLEHRRMRERQVLDALREGPGAAEELVPTIYGEYPPELHPAAARTLLAHLIKLEREGGVTRIDVGGREAFALAPS